MELKQILARQPGPEVAEQVQLYQQTLKDKTKQLKSMASELNMYEAQVKEYQYELERLSKELQEAKKKYYMQKRKEQQARYVLNFKFKILTAMLGSLKYEEIETNSCQLGLLSCYSSLSQLLCTVFSCYFVKTLRWQILLNSKFISASEREQFNKQTCHHLHLKELTLQDSQAVASIFNNHRKLSHDTSGCM